MNISLPFEQQPNPYVSADLSFVFHYFFMRKFWLVSPALAVIAFPGGFGTLDEFFETMTLIQTEKIARGEVTVILYGEEYWGRVIDFEAMARYGAISSEEAGLFTVFSDPEKAFVFLKARLSRTLKSSRIKAPVSGFKKE